MVSIQQTMWFMNEEKICIAFTGSRCGKKSCNGVCSINGLAMRQNWAQTLCRIKIALFSPIRSEHVLAVCRWKIASSAEFILTLNAFDVNHAIWWRKKHASKHQMGKFMQRWGDRKSVRFGFVNHLQPEIKLSSVHTTCEPLQKLKMQFGSVWDYEFSRVDQPVWRINTGLCSISMRRDLQLCQCYTRAEWHTQQKQQRRHQQNEGKKKLIEITRSDSVQSATIDVMLYRLIIE